LERGKESVPRQAEVARKMRNVARFSKLSVVKVCSRPTARAVREAAEEVLSLAEEKVEDIEECALERRASALVKSSGR
jgi:hypothetical protein